MPKTYSHPAPKKNFRQILKGRESGFTLMVSLVLLTSLLLVGVSLSTMASIELRKAEKKKSLTTARVNARVAAIQALELLQRTSGPDQRVTAPSSIWIADGAKDHDPKGTEQYWSGVYHSQKRTWSHEDQDWSEEGRIQNKQNGEYLIEEPLQERLDKQVWLVSGHDMKDAEGNYLTPKSVRRSQRKIVIHDGIELDEYDEADVHVLAVDIPTPEGSNGKKEALQSRYAFWISDEGTKAKVNIDESQVLQYPRKDKGSVGLVRDRLPLLSPRTSPVTMIAKDGSERSVEQRVEAGKKLVTPDTLKASTAIDEDAFSHHYTSSSKGVLADVARGGLKKDLSRGLGDQFKEKLAGKIMWTAPLPERKTSGVIEDLTSFRAKRDKNVNKRAPEQHRGFLRGPLWDLAHSWYSLYLPKPPFLMAFYGGVEDEFHPTKRKNQKHDLVGRSDDPTIYKYSENTLNRGPKSNVTHTTTPNLDPRSPGGAQAHNWIFRNERQTTKYFMNKPIWQHSNKDGENFKIDFTKNGYPRGHNYWRRENIRHGVAPVLIEYTLEFGMFTVDAAYLWDLTIDGFAHLFPYTCSRDGYRFFDGHWRDQPGNRPGEDDGEEVDPENPPTRTPMPACAVCNKQDQVNFIGGYRETNRKDPRFGTNIWDPNRQRVQNIYHLEKTKFRSAIIKKLLELNLKGVSADGEVDTETGWNGLVAHRTPKFRRWFYQKYPAEAKKYYEQTVHTDSITRWKEEFLRDNHYLDMEKHSRGLKNGNSVEVQAYALMQDMFLPVLMMKPTLVYWNPYNVQLNNVRPFAHTSPGNIWTRWVNSKIHLPDAEIITNQGPLPFYFSHNKRAVKTSKFTWMALARTPFEDRFMGENNNLRFDRWYGFGVPNAPSRFPFFKHDFRPGGTPNYAFRHDRSRFHYRTDIDRNSKDTSKTRAYNFAPGELKVFTPHFMRRDHNVIMSPEGNNGFFYSLPLSSDFLTGAQTIQSMNVFTYPTHSHEHVNGSGGEWRHRFAWEFETAIHSNRDTFKQKHTNPEYMHLGRLDRLVPESNNGAVSVEVGKNPNELYPRGFRWEDYDWWQKHNNPNWHEDYGGMRGGQPRVDGSRRSDSYGGPKVNNPFINKLVEGVSAQIQNHYFVGYNFRRKAADSNPGDSIASWAQLNARAHDVLSNGETDGAPFGWEGRILSRKETMKSVMSVSSGIAKWGASFTNKGQSRLAMVDVPRQPMHSIVELTHADLGQYNIAPTFAVGNSYVPPFIPPDQAYSTRGKYNLYPADREAFTQESNNRSTTKFFNSFNHTLPDFSYQLNKALFDRYFFSTIPDWPYNAQGAPYKNPQFVSRNYPPFEDFNQEFVDKYYDSSTANPDAYLPPNPRIRYYSPDGSPPDIEELHDMDTAAANLLVDGSFNINSTSVKAWGALLQTLKGVQFKHTMGVHSKTTTTAFLRSVHPYWGSNDIWQGFTELTNEEISELAEAIVEQVRKRGPFLSISHFINRSLVNPKDVEGNSGDPGEDPHRPWQSGPIQAALDKTVNLDKFNDARFGAQAGYEPKSNSHWSPSPGNGDKTQATNFFKENSEGMVMSTGIPGWTMQSDILRPLAPIINARSDTFTIRGYGEVKKNGSLQAKAMCEMLVQRVPEYVNNNAHSLGSEFLMHNKEKETWYDPDPGFEQGNRDRNLLVRNSKPRLMENFKLGRRYKILEFRWL